MNQVTILAAFVQSMVSRKPVTFHDANYQLHFGIINRIEAEDGSGRNFNIYLHTGVAAFVRIAR